MAWIAVRAKQMSDVDRKSYFMNVDVVKNCSAISFDLHIFLTDFDKNVHHQQQVRIRKHFLITMKMDIDGGKNVDVATKSQISKMYNNIVSKWSVKTNSTKQKLANIKKTVSVVSVYLILDFLVSFFSFQQACAPRYVFHTMQPKKVARVEPVGTCYMAKKNFQEFTEYSPCRTSKWNSLAICMWIV